jgi:glycosyltransferase involved in cell wall biosynthesis
VTIVEESARDAAPAPADRPTVSVVIPCLNEAETIEECVLAARRALAGHGIPGEVVVVDNGSADGSGELAARAGARVVVELRRGYGSAYLAGFAQATGDYIVMADADLTYDFDDIPRFVSELDAGGEFVIGDRMENIEAGAMPWLNRYVGNPVLTGLLNVLFRTSVRDAHCGMRAVRRDVLPRLDLRTTGMEFASEMVIRATQERLDIRQFPIAYGVRGGESKLSPFRDGWRHLRLLLVYNPTALFLLPGGVLAALGLLAMGAELANVSLFGRQLDIHTLIAGSLALITGAQVAALGICGHAYAAFVMGHGKPWFTRLQRRLRLEQVLLAGGAVVAVGLGLFAYIVVVWIDHGFRNLAETELAVISMTTIVLGMQTVFTAFLVSMLGLRRTDVEQPAGPAA